MIKFNYKNNAGAIAKGLKRSAHVSVAHLLFRTSIWGRTLNGPAPDRILVHPRNFYPKSAAEAELMLMGRYRLPGGEAIARDGSPFFVQAPSELWSESLHSFHWLRHFEAGDTWLLQDHVRQILAHWIRNYGDFQDIAWRPHVVARRLMTWASFGRLILSNADVIFRSRILLSMGRQARHLARTAHMAQPGTQRLTAAIGLVQSGVCLADGDTRVQKGLHLLAEEIGDQILPDGGHISRSPETLLEVTSDLLSLVDAMIQRDMIIPVVIRKALDRVLPMIRFMRHGDGRLALFHGGCETSSAWIDLVLERDTGRSRSFSQASQSAYQRIACNGTLMLVDAGSPPPPEFATHAHASALSFEFSDKTERVVVNCGAGQMLDTNWHDAMRATAAHTTLTIEDTSSAHIISTGLARSLLGSQLVSGPARVECRRRESDAGIFLDLSHDGYEPSFGLRHERRIFVSHEGTDIRGEDKLISDQDPKTQRSFAIRFHLHPAVKILRVGAGVLLTLSNGATWRFGADSEIHVADGIYLGKGHSPQKTHQLVLTGKTSDKEATCKWSFKKATNSAPHAL